MMQEYCRLLGISTSEKDLRDLGATLDALPADHPLGERAAAAMDFRHPDALADALLHPLDRAYTVPELYAWLERCGMSFGRWVEQAPYLAQCGMVAKSPHAARLASLPSPGSTPRSSCSEGRWSGTASSPIATMAGEGQPITFAGDRWRHYVPIALPWTVCVRERVPPGSVAVLINRAHTFHRSHSPRRLASRIACSAPSTGSERSPRFCGMARRTAWRAPGAAFLRAPLAIRPDRLRRLARRGWRLTTEPGFTDHRSRGYRAHGVQDGRFE